MKINYEIRHASNPADAKSYDTTRLRKEFLIETLFVTNEVNMVYSMIDRMIVGGAKPVGERRKTLLDLQFFSLQKPQILSTATSFTSMAAFWLI